ncbi:hypothetical protein ACH95_17150 [Bacillus glycinifermentans]|uniref:hypothetical protein n=1 Tax=Bacillus TaxID=1386 RepID=UPI0006544253|nr:MULTISPECIES: hypothetical protein [Bacillus]KMM56653.1 hypothetical protein ACH95_17150 [Bacillus glycinifermentans]MBU8788849.1 hypothetical protein [Bacillus glycinifermentans]MDR4955279.1 hypothetical protein [Bacillus sonorensis]MEC0340051.1 hypothetical protein [Bacillus sonorensis]MEC0425728.1 hypothetical protein [Bacillus sonorensis]
MNINVNIKAPGLAAAIQALANALDKVEVVWDSKAVAQETEETPQVETPPTEDVKEEPSTQEVEETPNQEEEETPAISKEVVRDKLAALAQEGKQAEVKKLFAKFGAKKLSEVPAEKYAELLKHAEAL